MRPGAGQEDPGRFVFLGPWVDAQGAIERYVSGLGKEVGVQKPGRAFYSQRHTFRTVADEIGDRPFAPGPRPNPARSSFTRTDRVKPKAH